MRAGTHRSVGRISKGSALRTTGPASPRARGNEITLAANPTSSHRPISYRQEPQRSVLIPAPPTGTGFDSPMRWAYFERIGAENHWASKPSGESELTAARAHNLRGSQAACLEHVCCMLLSLYLPVRCNSSRAVTLLNINTSEFSTELPTHREGTHRCVGRTRTGSELRTTEPASLRARAS